MILKWVKMLKEEAVNSIGLIVRINIDFASAVELTIAARKAEEFGVLTEVDAQETLKKKTMPVFA